MQPVLDDTYRIYKVNLISELSSECMQDMKQYLQLQLPCSIHYGEFEMNCLIYMVS